MQCSASIYTLFNRQSSNLITILSRFQKVVQVYYKVASLYSCTKIVIYSLLYYSVMKCFQKRKYFPMHKTLSCDNLDLLLV